MTNILVTAMLLTGGADVVAALTGMPTQAGCFLLPIFVAIYTMFGGIKATFLTDWVSIERLQWRIKYSCSPGSRHTSTVESIHTVRDQTRTDHPSEPVSSGISVLLH